jgi:multiple sugar transport system substrate-binding protein
MSYLRIYRRIKRVRMPSRARDSMGSAPAGRQGTDTSRVNLRKNVEETTVTYLTRRSMLRGSLAAAATMPVAFPHVAKAAATTASVWFAQGFVQDEDVALRKVVTDYEKQSGNKIELSIIPFAPERQKIISAITSGVVPDLFDNNPAEILQIYAWQDRWVDVADVVETQKAQFSETALQASQAYNSVTKKRGMYGVPIRAGVAPTHIWRPLVEKAGFKMTDIPKTWDAYFDFFKKVQDNLRKQGERKVYGLGFQVTANGVDPYTLFTAFMNAYGGQDLVTRDGKLHLDDPKVKQAAIKAAAYLGGAYRDGYVPPSAINWNDADDNNAYHARLMVMDLDGTLSTEVAVKEKHPEWYFQEMVTHGIGYPTDNAGKVVPSVVGVGQWLIPKGAKNVTVAKEFCKYFIQPKVLGDFVETGLGRWLPVMPALAKSPFWNDPKDPHLRGYIQQGLLGPTVPEHYVFNLAMAEVRTQHVWSMAMIDVAKDGVKPEVAVDKSFKRIEEIFAKYKA